MSPPGCPLRKVVNKSIGQHGVTFRLSCGHRQWEGGFSGVNDGQRPCLEGPCYRPQKFMGASPE